MRFLLIFIIVFTLLFNDRYSLVFVGDQSIVVQVVDTELERVRGLSHKKFLVPGFGMLFILDVEGRSGIWMKDMNFPIDIYWFTKDQALDHALKDISPDTYPNVFYSQGNVLYVLETRVGEIEPVNAGVLDKRLDLDLTYINKHDKNIKYLWQILQHLHFHLR